MSTTDLVFTLTSPGGNDPGGNNPTPGGTTGGTTTTIVGSPNTGDNTTTDNSGSTVFMALFAVIGLAALIVFLVRNLKKNRKLSFAPKGSFRLSARPRVFATASLVLAVALLGSMIVTKISSGNSADAATIDRTVTVEPELIFDVDRGGYEVLPDTIRVANNGDEYTLTVAASSTKFCLDGSTTSCLDATSGSIANAVTSNDTSKLSSIAVGQWGLSFQNDNTEAKVWAGVPTVATTIYQGTKSDNNVNYAVSLGDDLPDGTYRVRLTYRAYSTTNPEVEYTVTTHNGYVGRNGTEEEGTFKDGVQVWIRQNCGTKKFTGWTINQGDLKLTDLKPDSTDASLFYFNMPASNVVLTANCEGDTPTPDSWTIKYNVNSPNNKASTGTMADTTVTGDTATLSTNAFAIENYVFKGWSCTPDKPTDATLIHFSDAQSGITKAALEAKGCKATGSTYNLYAIWEYQEPSITYLQEVTPEMCDNMALFTVKKLKDRRDEQEYSYTKYADGRCWMLKDLNYIPGTGSISLTKKDTDISANRTVTFATSGTSGAVYHTQSGYSTLYNYKAATAGYYSTLPEANTTIPDSLCPAGWKMPDAQGEDGKFHTAMGELYDMHHYNIGKANGGGSSKSVTWQKDSFLFATNVTLSSGTSAKAPHFIYSGAWDFSTGAYTSGGSAGSYASYFMSTVRNDGKVAALNPHKDASSGDTNLDNGETDPTEGNSVRCLLRTEKQLTTRNAPVYYGDITD